MNKCPKCGVCGTLLCHINEACPNCLPELAERPPTHVGNPGWEIQDLRKRLKESERQLAAMQAENARLRAVVEKLPKTADGVVWLPWENKPVYWLLDDGTILDCLFDKYYFMPGWKVDRAWGVKHGDYENIVSDCYSTEAAALAAMSEEKKKP